MKTALAYGAIAIVIIALLLDIKSSGDLVMGAPYLWVAAAALIAAALWKNPKRDHHYHRFASAIYEALAAGPITYGKLLAKIRIDELGETDAHLKKTLVTMLDEGKLIIRGGKVCLPPQTNHELGM